VFWQSLAEVDETVLEVIQSADELSALEELAGRSKAEVMLDRMIAVLRARLSTLPEKSWYARWSDAAETTPPAV